MIDLHCHLLPGIDDGPPDVAGAVELARAAAGVGTRTIAATPHLRDDHPLVRPAELEARVGSLREHLGQAGIDLTVVCGGEVDLAWALRASDEDLRLGSYGQRGSDLLVETPYSPLASGFEDMIFRLTARGYRVLLAHPERNTSFQSNPSRLVELTLRGVLVQVTVPSLVTPRRGSRSRRTALDLIRDGHAHVLATDAHRGAGFRPPNLREGLTVAASVAPARARWMVTSAPAAVLAGEPLPYPPVDGGARRRSRWRRGLLARRQSNA
ncbi:MAG: tyrosine-protein phosphatase [Solirubrobacteraceae bacterium]